jgi:branched-chain amino acid transport system substrate-binding protein
MTSSQPNLYLGDYAYKKLGYRRMAIVEQDYAYGWESGGGFQYAFQRDGGTIVKKLYVPLNAADLMPYITHIPHNIDAVYAILVGAFVPRFEAEYRQSSLQGKVPVIGGPDMIDEDALAAAGANAVGLVGVHEYYKGLASAQSFVKAFRAAYGQTPSYWGESTYITAEWLSAAIQRQEAAGTKPAAIPSWILSHARSFIDDVIATRIHAPQGPMHMDRYHNAVMTLYIFRVTAPRTKKILQTIPNASQFWVETPSKFLAHPVFSRTYPS